MKKVYKAEELGVLPSLHDYVINNIELSNNQLIFKFDVIQKYDITKAQNITSNSLELQVDIDDADFCSVKLTKKSLFWNNLTVKEISLSDFIKVFNKLKYDLSILNIYTAYQGIIIECNSYDYNNIQLSLHIECVTLKYQ